MFSHRDHKLVKGVFWVVSHDIPSLTLTFSHPPTPSPSHHFLHHEAQYDLGSLAPRCFILPAGKLATSSFKVYGLWEA